MNKRLLVSVPLVLGLAGASVAGARESDELTAADLAHVTPHAGGGRAPDGKGGGQRPGGGLPGIDSIQNFTGTYSAPGFDYNGNPLSTWSFSIVGHSPRHGGTTVIKAPIVPVSVDLRNADGTPRFVNGQRLYSDATQFVPLVLNSPIFRKTKFSSSEHPTQITDAIFRAQFWNWYGDDDDYVHALPAEGTLDDDWHTLLEPRVRTPRVITLLKGTYHFALNDDGTCCRYILVDDGAFGSALFPSATPDLTTPVGAAEVTGEMTTKDMTTFLFPNVFLYQNNDPAQCCILGYHSFDSEPGDASNGNLPRFYVMNYSSWITPGLFGPDFADVTALSHEIAETFSDPFVDYDGVHNETPWWMAPNGGCQFNLEVGDVIEGLPNATYPITIDGFTYHPQNEALLSWFAFQSPSKAINGAYSYPDATVLTALSAPQKAGCQ
jgi:hypothetical protein